MEQHMQQQEGALTLKDRVQTVLNTIRPAVQSDGGDIELLDVTPDGIVKVKLRGSCVGCPSSMMTLTMGVERRLKSLIPEVTKLLNVM